MKLECSVRKADDISNNIYWCVSDLQGKGHEITPSVLLFVSLFSEKGLMKLYSKILGSEGEEALEQVSQRGCGCPIPVLL